MSSQSQDGNSAAKKSSEIIKSIDGQDLKDLFQAALIWLKNHQAVVNALNVFPVPDGDTGTNMYLTMQSAFQEVANDNEKNIGKIMQKIAH